MMASTPRHTPSSTRNAYPVHPGYFDLKTLAVYSSSSVRWLRDRLVNRSHPLPHYRIEGKILVKREEFDRWIHEHRVVRPSNNLDHIVESVMTQIGSPRRVA